LEEISAASPSSTRALTSLSSWASVRKSSPKIPWSGARTQTPWSTLRWSSLLSHTTLRIIPAGECRRTLPRSTQTKRVNPQKGVIIPKTSSSAWGKKNYYLTRTAIKTMQEKVRPPSPRCLVAPEMIFKTILWNSKKKKKKIWPRWMTPDYLTHKTAWTTPTQA